MAKLKMGGVIKSTAFNVAGGIGAAAINKVPFVASKPKMLVLGAKLLLSAFLPTIIGKVSKGKGAKEAAEGISAGMNGVIGLEVFNAVVAKGDTTKQLGVSGFPNVGAFTYNTANVANYGVTKGDAVGAG